MSQRGDSAEFEQPAPWRVGRVDRSETHIKVRYGGILDEDPPGVDIALVGPSPDIDGRLIVEFLPTPSLDPGTAEELKLRAAARAQMVTEGWPNPWWKLLRETSGTSNAYGPLRFLQQDAEGPLVCAPDPERVRMGKVLEQPALIEGVAPVGQFVIRNDGGRVGIQLIRRDETIEGRIWAIHRNWLAVLLTEPVPGGGVLRRIFEPYEDGYLIDEHGALTPYGRELAVALLYEMHRAAHVMRGHVEEIWNGIRRVRFRLELGRRAFPMEKEQWLRVVLRDWRGPRPEVASVFFKSVIACWADEELYGLRDPAMGIWRPGDLDTDDGDWF